MDAWESHFREKSRRRASRVSARFVAGWTLWALALVACVAAVLEIVGV